MKSWSYSARAGEKKVTREDAGTVVHEPSLEYISKASQPLERGKGVKAHSAFQDYGESREGSSKRSYTEQNSRRIPRFGLHMGETQK
jgi:hypothetical protein